jgi:hypothetical protein
MKLSFVLLVLLMAFVGPACQRISPSVSIPGYEEKSAAGEKEESRTLGTSDNPPTFFPGKETH